MLHSLPALLDDLEARLIAGEDPLPLLAKVRWHELIGWPSTREQARQFQTRLLNLKVLINTLEAPLRVALMKANQGASYGLRGGMPLPPTISTRIHHNV